MELVVSNWYGCTDTLSTTLSYRPNGLSMSIHYDWSAQISPNPGRDRFELKIKGRNLPHSQAQIEIYDLRGEMIEKFDMQRFQHSLNLRDRPAGVYILKLHYLGESKVYRLIKQ